MEDSARDQGWLHDTVRARSSILPKKLKIGLVAISATCQPFTEYFA